MKVLLTAVAASFALAAPAIAHERHDHGHDRDHRDHHRGDRDRDWDRDRDYRHDRWEDRRDRRDRWERRQWRRGDRLSDYDYRHYHRVDYRRYDLRRPPRGMVYLMDDYGDIILVMAGSNVVIAVNIR